MKTVNGTTYHDSTPDAVIGALESGFRTRARFRIWYGDTATGRAWDEENDVLGYMGRSTGRVKAPLLVHDKRSTGGPALLDQCIVRIDTTDGLHLYRHPQFDAGTWTHDGCDIYRDGVFFGKNKTPASAARFCQFMIGERYAK